MRPLSRLLTAARDTLSGRPSPPPSGDRRRFFRRAGVAAVGGGLLLADEAWAAVEERAARLGITPGTVVDERGRPVEPAGNSPWVGEVTLVPYNFSPRGWAFCNGQLLAVSQNDALFSLLGTTFGGDGRTTFGLPDLRGRGIVGVGTGPGLSPYRWGQRLGVNEVTLTAAQNAGHSHTQPTSTEPSTSQVPTNNIPALDSGTERNYNPAEGAGQTWSAMSASGGQPHNNMPPFSGLHYCIALQGIYPSRS